mgnify:CR=1 FL=1
MKSAFGVEHSDVEKAFRPFNPVSAARNAGGAVKSKFTPTGGAHAAGARKGRSLPRQLAGNRVVQAGTGATVGLGAAAAIGNQRKPKQPQPVVKSAFGIEHDAEVIEIEKAFLARLGRLGQSTGKHAAGKRAKTGFSLGTFRGGKRSAGTQGGKYRAPSTSHRA